jgi:hypothetical protein
MGGCCRCCVQLQEGFDDLLLHKLSEAKGSKEDVVKLEALPEVQQVVGRRLFGYCG